MGKLASGHAFASILSAFQAISSPSDDTQARAWEAVVPLVFMLKRFYLFSLKIGQCREGSCVAVSIT